jgi:hypothetical protein
MTTEELFFSVISKRNWYRDIGITRQNAYQYKQLFQKGKLGEKAMSSILIKMGYKKKITWE